jgi:hypothetical protein
MLRVLDEGWIEECQLSGVGSGEALIDSVGKEDKRRLVMESEFARLLGIIQREGTTISAIFRQFWDSGTANVTVRQKPAHVKGAHLSMIGHVTRDELLRKLADTELANGFANRILWPCICRSKELPFGGGSMNYDSDLLHRLRAATEHARKMGNTRMDFDADARRLWAFRYHDLSAGRPGLFGSLTSRAEAQVVRLSLIYALLDCAGDIRIEHLKAALAIWRYCEDSARYIWGEALGNPTAGRIIAAVHDSVDGITREDTYHLFGGNKSSQERDRAVAMLVERGLIRIEKEETSSGRPTVRYLRA